MKIPNIKQDPLDYILQNNLADKGAWLEFGVFTGRSINKISQHTKSPVYGFDTFKGLPEGWAVGGGVDIKRGHYSYQDYARENSLKGDCPKVNSNVILIKGLFSDTLPQFIKNQEITLLHIDCDIYSSTKDVFDNVTRNIKNNCIIVFDEFMNYPNYKHHEFKAFNEWVEANDIKFEYIGMNGEFIKDGQTLLPNGSQKVAIRIINNPKFKIREIAIIVNSHSSCKDIWPLFFGEFAKYYPSQKPYVLTDDAQGLPANCIPLIYSTEDSYRSQYLKSIQQIPEEFCISLNEDYILYSNVDEGEISYCLNFLKKNKQMSFVRLTKGVEYQEPQIADKIFEMNNQNMWFFSQVAGLWRTRDLELIHEKSPESGMAFKLAGPQLELVANDTCKELDTKGCFYYNNEPKRGVAHYDSSIFPYIATAVIKGKWNLREYPRELGALLKKHKIDPAIRGVY